MSKQGWWWPSNSRKAHYIHNGKSLCMKWGYLGDGSSLQEGNDSSKDNCAECKRRLIKWKGGK